MGGWRAGIEIVELAVDEVLVLAGVIEGVGSFQVECVGVDGLAHERLVIDVLAFVAGVVVVVRLQLLLLLLAAAVVVVVGTVQEVVIEGGLLELTFEQLSL